MEAERVSLRYRVLFPVSRYRAFQAGLVRTEVKVSSQSLDQSCSRAAKAAKRMVRPGATPQWAKGFRRRMAGQAADLTNPVRAATAHRMRRREQEAKVVPRWVVVVAVEEVASAREALVGKAAQLLTGVGRTAVVSVQVVVVALAATTKLVEVVTVAMERRA